MDAHVGGSPLRQHLNGWIAPDGGGLCHAPFCQVSGVGLLYKALSGSLLPLKPIFYVLPVGVCRCPIPQDEAKSQSHSLLSVGPVSCFERDGLYICFTQQGRKRRVSLIRYTKTKQLAIMIPSHQQAKDLQDEARRQQQEDEHTVKRRRATIKKAISLLVSYQNQLDDDNLSNLENCISRLKSLHPEWNSEN